jgi:hypothetical protein
LCGGEGKNTRGRTCFDKASNNYHKNTMFPIYMVNKNRDAHFFFAKTSLMLNSMTCFSSREKGLGCQKEKPTFLFLCFSLCYYEETPQPRVLFPVCLYFLTPSSSYSSRRWKLDKMHAPFLYNTMPRGYFFARLGHILFLAASMPSQGCCQASRN